MADKAGSRLPRLTPEQRRAAAGQFERANQVLAKGDYDYALPLLVTCCLIDPGNAVYRQVLRQAAKSKYSNNHRGQKLAALSNLRDKFSVRKAQLSGNPLKVLEHGEKVLLRNPWDIPAQVAMSEAFHELELIDLAVWTLEQARQVDPNHVHVNRLLARLYEKRGNFNQAIALWQLIRKVDPTDQEASNKAKDIAASATIAKGRYEQALHGQAPSPMAQQHAAPTQQPTQQPNAPLTEQVSDEEMEAEVKAPSPASIPAPAPPPAPDLPRDDRVRDAPALLAKIKADPANPLGYLHLAHAYRRAEQWNQARAVLTEGLAATANEFNLALELLDIDVEPFRRDLAIAEEKLRREPEHAELQKIRARLLKEVSSRELDYFRQKTERFPTDTASRFEMAVRLMRVGQTDEAIKQLQGLRGDPRHQSKVLVHLGFCFRSRNNWRLAQRNFEEALQHLGPGDDELRKETLYQLAQGYAESGEVARAVDLACELANLDFGYKDIGTLLDQWQARLQKA